MRISLSRDGERGERPVYRQIADQIQGEIEAARLEAGARLPTIRELARTLGVNRDTVAQAYDALAEAGLLESTVGRGTFVAAPAKTNGNGHAFQPSFPPLVDRLLAFERSRPRFGLAKGAIPLHAVVPDPALYPADAFRKALSRVLARGGPELLLYGETQGYAPLRKALSARLRSAGLPATPEEIVLCHGASQGISLALRLFASQGDAIALEEPTYNNALGAAHAHGLRSVPVPMTPEGPDLGALERALSRPDVKLFYTIPTFHNPMGTTTAPAHRRALLEIAHRCGKPIIEDGYEMDLRIDGRATPPLAGLDTSGLVVHLSSFSKSLFPGARVGAVVARGAAVDALLALKHASDLSDSLPLQAALAEFVESGEYERHLGRLRRALRERRDALLEALEKELPEGARWNTPEGGYQVWVELPGGIDTRDLLSDSIRAGVLFAPGFQFHHDGRASHCLRLSFAMAGPDALRDGAGKLGRLVRERLAGGEPRRASAIHV
ncbi:MAG TPA: PLP-dependent aminotransferase family protein [Myxococcota bacterium]|nr:PLP-dependent aminotransferase family protein [Myxococcota bacterium]